MKHIKPNSDDGDYEGLRIFIAGTIEMGNSEDWQSQLVSHFNTENKITFYNPRRDEWDITWKQEQKNTKFNEQVNWELNRLEQAEIIFMYFSPESKSPISLLELGLFADSGKMIVCCPKTYWRRGNIEIVCTRHNIVLFDVLDDAIGSLETRISMIS